MWGKYWETDAVDLFFTSKRPYFRLYHLLTALQTPAVSHPPHTTLAPPANLASNLATPWRSGPLTCL